MSHTINANLASMFSAHEPWDVSNSVANLGPRAGELTGGNALDIAAQHHQWLESDPADAAEAMRDWARWTGGWEREEIAAWTDIEALALFVQHVASELRDKLKADDQDLIACVELYAATDWESENEYVAGYYHIAGGVPKVEYYAGF